MIPTIHTDGQWKLIEQNKNQFPRLLRVWADGGYAGKLVEWVSVSFLWVLELVKRTDDLTGFNLLPHRWVVERRFAWVGGYRRLSNDYEECADSSEAFIRIAMSANMSRRIANIKR